MNVEATKKQIKSGLKTLKDARDLLATGAWTRGELARKGNNDPVENPLNPKACKFCSIGAVQRAALAEDIGWRTPEDMALRYLNQVFHDPLTVEWKNDIATLNDRKSTTLPQVLNAFDFAILLAKDDLKVAK